MSIQDERRLAVENAAIKWSLSPRRQSDTARLRRALDEYLDAVSPRQGSSSAERQAAYRNRKRGGPPREPKPCGTIAAARRHQRHGEPLDDACRAAYNAEQRRLYRRRKR